MSVQREDDDLAKACKPVQKAEEAHLKRVKRVFNDAAKKARKWRMDGKLELAQVYETGFKTAVEEVLGVLLLVNIVQSGYFGGSGVFVLERGGGRVSTVSYLTSCTTELFPGTTSIETWLILIMGAARAASAASRAASRRRARARGRPWMRCTRRIM